MTHLTLSRRMLLSALTTPLWAARSADSGEAPIVQPYFPSPAHQFVWRNWDLVPCARIARALKTDEQSVQRMGQEMYLNADAACSVLEERLEFNVLRRNWSFVPREQIAALLDFRDSDLERLLDRDAFYRSHLGSQPSFRNIELLRNSSKISSTRWFKSPISRGTAEARFAFEKELTQSDAAYHPLSAHRPLVIAYPYFCPYGDVLGDPKCLSYYPAGLLERMAQRGVSAIWVHALLRDLVPSPLFQEDYPFDPARPERLRRIIARCRQAGLAVYLYLNEPRAAHQSFYKRHPDMQGAPGRQGDGLWCMCTSSEETRQFLRESSQRLFQDQSELSGVILITASENPTNCYSLTRHPACPRCSRREGAAIIGEVVREIAAGAKAGKASAQVIAWDWSWGIVEDDPQAAIIRALPDGVSLLVDFERGAHIIRDGTPSQVDEYSLSTTGPSERAEQHLKLAKSRGLQTLGKAQIGTTWELGTLPFLAVPDLVADKVKALQRAGVHGGMFSWTLGAYPSLNWEVLHLLLEQPHMSAPDAIRRVAAERYGTTVASRVQQCWSSLSETFRSYPFSNSLVYSSFVQEGPATPLFVRPSHRKPKILNSFDNLEWTEPFGAAHTAAIFRDMGQRWNYEVGQLRAAETEMDGYRKQLAQRDLRIIEAAGLYFDSIASIIDFYQMRDLQFPDHRKLRANLEQQINTAERFLQLCEADSRIGFEASVGYMYFPLDVREKVAACRYLLDKATIPKS